MNIHILQYRFLTYVRIITLARRALRIQPHKLLDIARMTFLNNKLISKVLFYQFHQNKLHFFLFSKHLQLTDIYAAKKNKMAASNYDSNS